jgi:hypothetical protein
MNILIAGAKGTATDKPLAELLEGAESLGKPVERLTSLPQAEAVLQACAERQEGAAQRIVLIDGLEEFPVPPAALPAALVRGLEDENLMLIVRLESMATLAPYPNPGRVAQNFDWLVLFSHPDPEDWLRIGNLLSFLEGPNEAWVQPPGDCDFIRAVF